MSIRKAIKTDIPSMVVLMNSAYRGEASKKGWTTEADMVEGELRTDEDHLNELMKDPNVHFLKFTSDNNQIEGCVFLQKRKNKLYLGMLSVNPELQAKGIGKQLMKSAEDYAKQLGCESVIMRVIHTRHELIAWYERQGYQNSGKVEPFEDSRFGKAKTPIQFIVMEKKLIND